MKNGNAGQRLSRNGPPGAGGGNLTAPRRRIADVIARLRAVAQAVARDYEGEEARFKARIRPHFHHRFAKSVVKKLQKA